MRAMLKNLVIALFGAVLSLGAVGLNEADAVLKGSGAGGVSSAGNVTSSSIIIPDGTAANPGLTYSSLLTTGLYANSGVGISVAGAAVATFNSSGMILSAAKKINQYNGINTAGNGVPIIVAAGRSTAQSAAVGTVATYTVPAVDASYEVSGNILVTTATTHAFTMTVAYTDEGNTARTATVSFFLVAGGTLVTSVANAAGAVPYMGLPQHIRAKAATTITCATTGTFTTVTYNVECVIKQTA